jgi:excisionase family DNA binding protein
MNNTLTVADVAKRLQMSLSAIYKYTESGKIPSIKLGNRTRVMEDTLNIFLKSCETKIPEIEKMKL